MAQVPTGPANARALFRSDPITFEILQHRLWSVIEEAAEALKRVSGSPVATEIHDMNIGLMDASGASVMIGHYSAAKATTLSSVVRDIIAEYQENPGIYPGDAFLCNDPYVGLMHQNDVAVVVPLFVEGRLIAWVGAEIHQIDVGGPTPGQVQLGARDIYGEAPLLPPLKIVEGGRLRKDVERAYLRRSRVPELIGLDLRAKIAACNTVHTHMLQLIEQYSCQTIVDMLEGLQDYAELRFRQRLREIPDGCWRHRSYIEFGKMLYLLHITLWKRDDRLTIDFRGTAQQASATINITRVALHANVLGHIVSKLCWDIPRAVGGISRAVTILTEPGTIVDALYPAGVSKSTTSTGLMIGGTLSLLISKMLLGSEQHSRSAMGGWPGAKAQEELHGVNQRGDPFAADILDGMAGGGGARTWRDGVDTGGLGSSAKVTIANVERYEFAYPILYLYRRELADSGGAGKFRGGNGIDRAYMVYGREQIDDVVLHCTGYEIPASSGLAGGYPSATNQFSLLRESNIWSILSERIPDTFEEISGRLEVKEPLTRTSLHKQDVYRSISNGGCGYGDPLARDFSLIALDIEQGRVSREMASVLYGVIIRDGAIDPQASEERRSLLHKQRLDSATPGCEWTPPSGPLVGGRKVTEHMSIAQQGSVPVIVCTCGRVLAPADRNYKEFVAFSKRPIQEIGPYVHPSRIGQHRIEFREFFCPGCGVLLETELARPEDSLVWDYQPFV